MDVANTGEFTAQYAEKANILTPTHTQDDTVASSAV